MRQNKTELDKARQLKSCLLKGVNLLIAATLLLGCMRGADTEKQEQTDSQQPELTLSVTEAMDAYNSRLLKSQKLTKSGTKNEATMASLGEYTLDWQNAVAKSSGVLDWVDVPISSKEYSFRAQHLMYVWGGEQVVHSTVNVWQRLVVVINEEDDPERPSSYIQSLIPAPDYESKNPGDLNDKFDLGDYSDYSGYVMYHSIDGDLIGLKYIKKGVRTFVAFTHNDTPEQDIRDRARLRKMIANFRVLKSGNFPLNTNEDVPTKVMSKVNTPPNIALYVVRMLDF